MNNDIKNALSAKLCYYNIKVNYSKQAMNLNFPPKSNLKSSITEKRYKTLL